MSRLNGINSYFIYYGCGGIECMTTYDLVVLEPRGQSLDSVEALKKSGSVVLGYLSMTEVAPWRLEQGTLILDDLIQIEGSPAINADFGNLIASLTSVRWQETMMEEIYHILVKLKMDGLFLDTLSNLEREDLTSLQRKQEEQALVDFVERVRRAYPEIILVQNNGIVSVMPAIISLMDGLLLENSPIIHRQDPFHKNLMKRTLALAKEHGLAVFSIISRDYMKNQGLEEEEIMQFCRMNGIVARISDEHYLELE